MPDEDYGSFRVEARESHQVDLIEGYAIPPSCSAEDFVCEYVDDTRETVECHCDEPEAAGANPAAGPTDLLVKCPRFQDPICVMVNGVLVCDCSPKPTDGD
ncbi:MAG: hypothetical protein AAF799_38550 [Myxococcota bacterium]